MLYLVVKILGNKTRKYIFVKTMTRKMLNFMSTRLGFVLTLLTLYWLKTMWAYSVDFNLDIQGAYQVFLAIINPLPLGLLLIGLAFYIKKTKVFYILAVTLYILLFVWLISNSIYYREFSDFVTVNTMLASSSVSAGLGEAALELFRPGDLIYIIDFPILGFLFYKKWIRLDDRPFNKRASFAITALSSMLFSANLFLAEVDRPELLTRGFSNYYVVRALGLPAFLGYSANQTYSANKERSKASAEDLKPVEEYVKSHYAEPNKEYYGIAKGRNVIYLHLESFQQFLIDYKLKSEGKEYEVTPFLNSLYHSNSTFAFSNIFNQVKAGKTSDAETMLETGLFGLNQGSFMVNYGLMTGIFLDQHEIRGSLVDGLAAGKSLLNMFSYTAAFSVAAAMGGASQTTSVDLAKRSRELSEAHFRENNLDLSNHTFFVMDVFDYFKYAKRHGLTYDVIVLDPPSFARNKKQTFSVAKDYHKLIAQSLEILNPQGIIIASTNAANISRTKFKKEIEKGFAGSKHRYLKEYGLPADFTYNKKDERSNYLKVFTIKVDK